MSAAIIDLKGKRAVVTGGGSGIGEDISCLLAACGAHVTAIGSKIGPLEALVQKLGPEKCQFLQADLSDPVQAAEACRKAGDIDLLVNNAGIAITAPFLTATTEELQKTIAVNVQAMMVMSQVAAKNMIARKVKGAIVNVSSQASLMALPSHTTYCVSKAAVDHLTRQMATELGPHGIRVNSVNPTVVLTPMGERAWGDPAKAKPMLDSIPLGRFATPREVSNVVAFLLSDLAAMVTGVIVPIDGGFCCNHASMDTMRSQIGTAGGF